MKLQRRIKRLLELVGNKMTIFAARMTQGITVTLLAALALLPYLRI
jgi:hypothetical protein